MKAALLKSYGDVDQFEIADLPAPKPGPGEILIKIEASAVNPFDLILRQGFMAQYIPLPLPAVLGGDAAGTISALGEGVTGFAVGDRVVADFAANGKGAHAEYGVVPSTSIARLPAALGFEQGASLVKAGLTGRQTVEALGVKAERLNEGRALAGEALDITVPAASSSFHYAISTAGPVACNLIGHVRDGGTVASIVPVPEGANAAGRVIIRELYHRTDAAMLDAILASAASGELVIPISHTFTLEQIGLAQSAVAAGAPGKVVLKH
ncbi:NADP-dependent oxidoreductase [Bradyrhizobium sp. BRP14]|nr:NADP-dependent oxidoreductase [Bradyrhizobium sp. BRP14]